MHPRVVRSRVRSASTTVPTLRTVKCRLVVQRSPWWCADALQQGDSTRGRLLGARSRRAVQVCPGSLRHGAKNSHKHNEDALSVHVQELLPDQACWHLPGEMVSDFKQELQADDLKFGFAAGLLVLAQMHPSESARQDSASSAGPRAARVAAGRAGCGSAVEHAGGGAPAWA